MTDHIPTSESEQPQQIAQVYTFPDRPTPVNEAPQTPVEPGPQLSVVSDTQPALESVQSVKMNLPQRALGNVLGFVLQLLPEQKSWGGDADHYRR